MADVGKSVAWMFKGMKGTYPRLLEKEKSIDFC